MVDNADVSHSSRHVTIMLLFGYGGNSIATNCVGIDSA